MDKRAGPTARMWGNGALILCAANSAYAAHAQEPCARPAELGWHADSRASTCGSHAEARASTCGSRAELRASTCGSRAESRALTRPPATDLRAPATPPPDVGPRVPVAYAEDAPLQAELDALSALLARAEFSSAEARVDALLTRADLPASIRNNALELLAIVQLAGRNEDAARATLAALYARDPGHQRRVQNTGPYVDAAFERARARAVAPALARLAVGLMRDAADRLVLSVELPAGRDVAQSLHTFVRLEGDGPTSHLVTSVRGANALRILLPPALAGAGSAELYVEARAPSGAVLGAAGLPTAPLRLALPAQLPRPPLACLAPEEPPLRRAWWLWTSLGVVIAGLAVGGAIAAH